MSKGTWDSLFAGVMMDTPPDSFPPEDTPVPLFVGWHWLLLTGLLWNKDGAKRGKSKSEHPVSQCFPALSSPCCWTLCTLSPS